MSREIEIKGKDSTGVMRTIATDSSGNLLAEMSGDVAADAADSGNPTKIGGVARTANPTAVASGDRVNASFDDLGRLLVWPFQVRDLIATASASLSTGTETTLLAGGGAGVFHDLLEVTASNNSGAAQVVSIRDGTAGGVVRTITAEANKTVSLRFPIPVVQNTAAAAWTVDMDDVTGTTITIDALFIKNV